MEEPPYRERRHQPDGWLRLLWWCSGLGWLILLLVLLLYHLGRPQTNFGLWRYWQLPIRHDWLEPWLGALPWGLASCILLSLLTLGLGRRRARRQEDVVLWYDMLLLIISLVGLAGYGALFWWP